MPTAQIAHNHLLDYFHILSGGCSLNHARADDPVKYRGMASQNITGTTGGRLFRHRSRLTVLVDSFIRVDDPGMSVDVIYGFRGLLFDDESFYKKRRAYFRVGGSDSTTVDSDFQR